MIRILKGFHRPPYGAGLMEPLRGMRESPLSWGSANPRLLEAALSGQLQTSPVPENERPFPARNAKNDERFAAGFRMIDSRAGGLPEALQQP